MLIYQKYILLLQRKKLRFLGRVARRRSAKPYTAVRICQKPQKTRVTAGFFLPIIYKIISFSCINSQIFS